MSVTDSSENRPPALGRFLIGVAGAVVPSGERSQWRARWESGFRDWWTLVERGELIFFGPAQIVQYCRDAFVEAFWHRFSKDGLRDLVRGPGFVLAGLGTLAGLTGLLSHGFAGTRALVELARELSARVSGVPADSLVGHGFSLCFGLGIGLGAASLQRLPLLWHGWRYSVFFIAKTASLVALVALVWTEAGAALWARTPVAGHPAATLYFALWVSSMAAFGLVTLWSCADQRRRCPKCLRRLSLPVTVGSWASVLEPATTELLCEAGHGSLSMTDTDSAEPDRWVVLGPSWKELFQTAGR